ncbi:MAG: hypothetical protein AAB420_01820 [Patescibacteria group bacterium]
MPTTKHRVNVSLSDPLERALAYLARRDRVPQATKAADLLKLAIEIEEDGAWDRLAQARDTKKARFVSHAKAWS